MNRIKILVAFCIIIPILSFSDSLDSQRCLDYAGIEYLLEHGDPYNGIGSRCQNGLTIKEFLSTPELSMSTDSFDDGNVELFIPAVEKVSGMYTDEIWFASEYSNRRKQLYEGVHINTNTIYSCYLKGGIIRRKRD